MHPPCTRRTRPLDERRLSEAGCSVRSTPLYGDRAAMKTILYAFCGFAAAALAQQNRCANLESGVEAEVLRVRVASDDVGVFRTVGDRALAALKECPRSARLWYLAA